MKSCTGTVRHICTGSSITRSSARNDPYLIMPTSGDHIGRRFVNGDADDDITNHFLEVR